VRTVATTEPGFVWVNETTSRSAATAVHAAVGNIVINDPANTAVIATRMRCKQSVALRQGYALSSTGMANPFLSPLNAYRAAIRHLTPYRYRTYLLSVCYVMSSLKNICMKALWIPQLCLDGGLVFVKRNTSMHQSRNDGFPVVFLIRIWIRK